MNSLVEELSERLRQQGCTILEQGTLPTILPAIGRIFINYPLTRYILNGPATQEQAEAIWDSALCAGPDHYLTIADQQQRAFAIFAPPGAPDITAMDFFRHSLIRITKTCGLGSVLRTLKNAAYMDKVKKQYINDKCWYLYVFGCLPEWRGKGIGKRVLQPMLDELDRLGHDCYLETYKEVNVEIYRHFGFQLLETKRLPGTTLTLYVLFRKTKPTNPF